MTKRTLTYESETVLPETMKYFLNVMEGRLCAISSEPDKVLCIMRDFEHRLIVWMSDHEEKRNA